MSPAADDVLELQNVSLALADEPLFAPLALTVRSGEAATVMGPSGCGKSSLLAYICGTLPPVFTADGDVRLGGAPLNGLLPEQRPSHHRCLAELC